MKRSVNSWARDIEKLHRLDGKSWERIREVALWTQSDGFWAPNVLSGKKLREKFDTLSGQMRRPRTDIQKEGRTGGHVLRGDRVYPEGVIDL